MCFLPPVALVVATLMSQQCLVQGWLSPKQKDLSSTELNDLIYDHEPIQNSLYKMSGLTWSDFIQALRSRDFFNEGNSNNHNDQTPAETEQQLQSLELLPAAKRNAEIVNGILAMNVKQMQHAGRRR